MVDTVDELLATAAPRTTTVRICGRGDLVSEHERLLAELQTARTEVSGLTSSPARDLAQRIQQVEADIDAAAINFEVSSISRRRWADLLAQNAPTKRQRLEGKDHNPLTFPPQAIAASITSPPVTVEQVNQMVDKLPAGEWLKLWNTVLAVNLGEVNAPKSAAAAAILRTNDGSLASPPTAASPDPSSSDGSGDPSQPTATTTTDD